MRSPTSLPALLAAAVLTALPAAALPQTPPGPAPAPLTFGDALARMRGSHETLHAADKELSQREEERKATKALYWPKVEVGAKYVVLDAPIEMDLNLIREVILTLHPQVPAARVPSFVETIQDERFWKANVEATWPIFTGGKVAAANRAAEARVSDVAAQRRQTEESLAAELVRRYYGLRLTLSARAVRQEVLKGLDRHLHDATRLEEEGLISRAERLNAAVARADADRQLRRVEQDVDIARAGLANILSLDEVGDPASPLVIDAKLGPVEQFQKLAQEKQPAFARFAAQNQLAEQAVKAERGRWLPDVYLFGTRELHESDLTILDPTWAVGIGAKWTLFDGFERSHKTGAAKLQQGRVNDLERRARRDVATLVEKRYRELTKAREQFVALDAALELAQENLRVRTRAFEEGLATSLDVVDARLSLSRVELERLLAAYEFDVAVADLLEASGQGDQFEQVIATGKPVTQ
jgi:outer membrane protein TolC